MPASRKEQFLSIDALKTLEIGIILLDCAREEIVFISELAVQTLKSLPQLDFKHIIGLFCSEASLESAEISQQSIMIEDRHLGFTVYPAPPNNIWVLLRDVTDKIRFETIAESMNLMHNIGLIFSGLIHELGNPMNSIKVAISVLKKNLNSFPPDSVHEYLDNVLGELGRMEYLLKTMKSFNAYEKLQKEDVDLLEFFNSLQRMVHKDMEKRGVQLSISCSISRPTVRADPRALQHVILNLLTNSLDAVARQPKPVIAIKVRRVNNRIMIEFHDNGCGIPEDDLDRIFLPFFTSKVKGTGLGLVIVKKLLTEMEATIEISSRPDGGTTAIISMLESRHAKS